jgi:tetratricopeptide (TPR) repeat protein
MMPIALDHLGRVPQDSRFFKNAVVYRALMLRDSGRIDQSIQTIRKALQNDPQQADYYLYLGTFYEELDQYEKALDILSQGLSVDNRNVRLHFRVGVIQDKAGRKNDAIAAMKNVLELQPEDAEALNYLGYTYAELGIHLDEAENLVRSALRIKPNDGYITDSLAWVYYKQGRYEEALDWLKKAETLVPDDPVILEHLGDVHLKLKRQEKAIQYYQRSLELNEKDREQLEKKIRVIQNDSQHPNQ